MNNTKLFFIKLLTSRKYRSIALFSLLAFIIIVVSLVYFILSLGKPYMGVTISLDNEGWVVETVDVSGRAVEVGITVGDSPVTINSQPAEDYLEEYKSIKVVTSELINELTVSDNQGNLKSASLKDNPPSWKSTTELVTLFFVSLVFWIIGFYIYCKRPENTAAKLFFLCSLASGLTLSLVMATARAIPIAFYLGIITAVITPWLLLHFFIVLPEKRIWPKNNWSVYLIYLPAIMTIILFPVVGYTNGQSLPWFRSLRLFEIVVAFLAIVSVAIYNYLHAISPITRQQMKIILVGCLAALIPFLILSILPETIWGKTILPPGFGILFGIFIPISMGYAIVTKKLMNIDFIIRRGIIYGLIIVVMSGILSLAIYFILNFQDSLSIPGEILIAIATGGIATLLFGPLRKGIEYLIDKFIYRDRYNYRQIIQSLEMSLNSAKDLTSVSRLIVGTIVHTLNLTGGCLYVKTQSKSYQVGASQGIFNKKSKQRELLTLVSQHNHTNEFPNNASKTYPNLAFLIPLIAVNKEVGFLCLSQKASKQDFSSDDMFLLQEISFVAAIALHSAILVRDVSIRDTFISIASHELRIPLTSVVGYSDLLLHRNPTNTIKKQWASKILENGQRLNAILDDLLNVSQIQSGKVNIVLEKVKLSDVVEEVLSLAKEQTDKHEFVINLETNLPIVLIDRNKLSHVVMNLLSNAIKYSPKGGRISLSLNHEQEKHQIIISVTDEGMGIHPADKESLFTAFHRIRRLETQNIRGNGLGLFIAKEWTEAMGGKIWVESELNNGSTFFISIPTEVPITTRDNSYVDTR